MACNVSVVTNNERLTIVQLGNLFVVNVYLPDASVSGRNEIICDICSQIGDSTDLHDYKSCVIVGGDFNLEFKNGSTCCQDLNSFISDFLICVFVIVIFTLMLATHTAMRQGCSSWVDNFFILRKLHHLVSDAKIVESGSNLIHCPIWINFQDVINFTANTSNRTGSINPLVSRLRWDKADAVSYYELKNFLSNINLNSSVCP